jgi:hypothetical protein
VKPNPRFSLRTLIVVMLLAPPALAAAWWTRTILPFIVFGVAIFAVFQLGLMHGVDAFANARPILPQISWLRLILVALFIVAMLIGLLVPATNP